MKIFYEMKEHRKQLITDSISTLFGGSISEGINGWLTYLIKPHTLNVTLSISHAISGGR
jgi:hypothetical protein